jgi:integrase
MCRPCIRSDGRAAGIAKASRCCAKWQRLNPTARRAWCDQAGLSSCSFHGLRKAACRRLAEAGCSASEIAAISGHATLHEVGRYTKAADQAKLAKAALGRIANGRVKPEPDQVSNRLNPLAKINGL